MGIPRFLNFGDICHFNFRDMGYFSKLLKGYAILGPPFEGLIGCTPVRGNNPRALESELSYVQVDKHGKTILYYLHQCRPYISRPC